jgi:glycosyltransferase involved in cell wall biosynthesis
MRREILHLQKVAGIAGSETYLLSLLPGLRDRGWDVRMLMLHTGEEGATEFADELGERGVPVDEIRLRADVDPLAFAQLVSYLARRRPALLHTHLVHADVYGQLAAVSARVPVRLSTKHGFNEFRENRGFALADRLVAGLADVHIAVSRGLARYLAETEGFAEDGFQIVHYGIRADDPPPAYDGPPRLLCIGRLIPIKGHLVLLRAFAQALAKVPELELRIAGRGPLDPALRSVIDEMGLGSRVRLLGQVSPIQKAIEDVGVVVVPSLGEGFGMVARSLERTELLYRSLLRNAAQT